MTMADRKREVILSNKDRGVSYRTLAGMKVCKQNIRTGQVYPARRIIGRRLEVQGCKRGRNGGAHFATVAGVRGYELAQKTMQAASSCRHIEKAKGGIEIENRYMRDKDEGPVETQKRMKPGRAVRHESTGEGALGRGHKYIQENTTGAERPVSR